MKLGLRDREARALRRQLVDTVDALNRTAEKLDEFTRLIEGFPDDEGS